MTSARFQMLILAIVASLPDLSCHRIGLKLKLAGLAQSGTDVSHFSPAAEISTSSRRVRAGTVVSTLVIGCLLGAAARDVAALERALTAVRWVRNVRETAGNAPETTEWIFEASGAFVSRVAADFADRRTGAWTISEARSDGGMLLLADSTRGRFDALSVTLSGDELRLGEAEFRGEPLPGESPPSAPSASDLEALAPGTRERRFSLWLRLTTSKWERTSTSAKNFEPDEFLFSRTGRFSARYWRGPCELAGTWSLWSAGGSSEIQLSFPSNACDPRGPRAAFVRGMPVRLDGERLYLHDGEYAPVSR